MAELQDQADSDKKWIEDTVKEVEAKRQDISKTEEKHRELQQQRDVVAKSIQSSPSLPQVSATPQDARNVFDALAGCFQAMADCADCPEETKAAKVAMDQTLRPTLDKAAAAAAAVQAATIGVGGYFGVPPGTVAATSTPGAPPPSSHAA